MITRQPFGRTGQQSTRTIFNAAALAHATPSEAGRTLDLLAQYGVNHINMPAECAGAEVCLGTRMPGRRDQFFLATTIRERFRDEARDAIARSLERLRVDYVDLLQLGTPAAPYAWEAEMGMGGALEAAIEAREQGLVRFLGVTEHGPQAPAMLLRSLDRYPFESVLLPYNYLELQQAEYRAGVQQVLDISAAQNVAVQTSEAIARRPWTGPTHPAATWYEPLTDPAAIALAVWWVLREDNVFLLTPGDLALLPAVLDAAGCVPVEADGPSAAQMEQLVAAQGMTSLLAR